MGRHFSEICCNLYKTFLRTVKGCHVQLHSFLSWTGSSLPVHADWCVYTHDCSFTPPGKKYHSKVTCQGTKTKAGARIRRLKRSREFAPNWLCSRILSDDTAWGDDTLCSYYIRKVCIVFIQFQELTGRPVKAVCNGFRGRNSLLLPKGFLWMQPETFQCMQLLCMFISTYWETSQGERHQEEKSQYGAQ